LSSRLSFVLSSGTFILCSHGLVVDDPQFDGHERQRHDVAGEALHDCDAQERTIRVEPGPEEVGPRLEIEHHLRLHLVVDVRIRSLSMCGEQETTATGVANATERVCQDGSLVAEKILLVSIRRVATPGDLAGISRVDFGIHRAQEPTPEFIPVPCGCCPETSRDIGIGTGLDALGMMQDIGDRCAKHGLSSVWAKVGGIESFLVDEERRLVRTILRLGAEVEVLEAGPIINEALNRNANPACARRSRSFQSAEVCRSLSELDLCHTASLCVGSGRNSILLIYTIISIVCQAK